MIGIVLGNGPSKRLYNRSGDIVIGCNIPTKEISIDATVICDEEIAWILKNNLTLVDVPVIISTKVFEKFKEFKIEQHFDILKVFKPKDWHNAAHYAAEYLIELECDEIYLWGCDSIFEDDIRSTTPGNKNDPRFHSKWRQVWNNIYLNTSARIVAMRLPK